MRHILLALCFLFSAASLMAVGSISGVVTAPPLGTPLPGVTITVLRGSSTVVASTTTAGNGSYVVSGLAAGEYVVRASLLGFQTGVVGAIVVDGQNTVVNFSLGSNPGTISGSVLDNGSHLPIVGAVVNAVLNDVLVGSATTDGSGNYAVQGLPVGAYVVTAGAAGHQTGTTGAIVVGGQTTVANFSLLASPGTISGTVTSAGGGLPVSGALVQVTSGDVVIYSALTNGSGNYAITGVAPGSYTVTAAGTGLNTGAAQAIVLSNQTTTVNFSLQANPGMVAGTVTSAGSGLPGALVEVNLGSVVVASAVTDSAGNYAIAGVTPGSYIVHAYATNFQAGTSGAIVVSNQTTTVNFALQPNPGTISGAVTSVGGGLPIASALIQVSNGDEVIDSGLTDSSGDYVIAGLAPGSYAVTATAATFNTGAAGAIVVSNQTTTVNLSLQASPGTISGTVTSAQSGLPIVGALIEVSLNNGIVFSSLTDSSGNYTISGVAPGSYVVQAHANGFQTGATGGIVLSNQTTTVNFSLLSSPGAIVGTVTSAANGLPVAGVLVEVNLGSVVIDSGVTDGSGNYSIPGIASGAYIVHAYAANFQTGTSGAIVLSNQTTTVNFALQPSPGAIGGTVISTGSGLPIAGALIQVGNGSEVIDAGLTDTSGDYVIAGVAPGSYTVTATAALFGTGVTGAIVLSNQTVTANFSLPASPGIVSGTVTSAQSGLPIAGVLVEVSLGNVLVFSTLTDNSGNYSILGVAPGSYVVGAHANGFQIGTTGAIVLSNQTATVNFSLPSSPGAISGTVLSVASGLPIPGAVVEVNLGSVVISSAVTDGSGNYSIPGIVPGAYIVNAYAANFQTGTSGAIVIANQTTTVNFALQPNPGILSGTVMSAGSGLPLTGAMVEVSFNDVVLFSAITNSSGNYSISGIAPGSYVINASAPNQQTAASNATVSSGQTMGVSFSLQASPGTIAGTVTSAQSGLPIAGAQVEVNLNNVIVFTAVTDNSGNYSISGVAPNAYAVHAHAATFQTAINSSVIVSSNATATANFSLQSNPGAVQGTVTDSITGLPLSGVFIQVFENGILIDVAVTDAAGNYSVPGLAADNYTLIASKTNYDNRNANFTVVGSGTTTLNLTLIPNFPPTNLTGSALMNSYLLQADRVHRIRWVAALGGNIANYRVYRNGILIATVSPNGPLQYDDHNQSSRVLDNYAVTAINAAGSESAAASVVLR